MAEIFLAQSRGLEGFEKLVVVKRILPQLAADPQFLRMFLDEARLMATLGHTHIAQVYDVGKEGDRYFFAMEYIHGEDLREVLQAAKGPLPLPHAIGVGAAIAAGLQHAHAAEREGVPLSII